MLELIQFDFDEIVKTGIVEARIYGVDDNDSCKFCINNNTCNKEGKFKCLVPCG